MLALVKRDPIWFGIGTQGAQKKDRGVVFYSSNTPVAFVGFHRFGTIVDMRCVYC